MDQKKKVAIIIGAGPGGLTAAYELLTRTDITPLVFEKTNSIGGISRTVNYKGNRIDIGGHRFFSKSERVMKWWRLFLPLQDSFGEYSSYSNPSYSPIDPEKVDKVMLIRNRLSRIFYLRNFFDYPISLNPKTLRKLGIVRIIRIGKAYVRIRLFPIKIETNLEDFFINRFGEELYLTFFKDYTEKVWGIPCNEIKPEWGAQRIKGLSVSKALKHAVKSVFKRTSTLEQKRTETSLIDKFMYPKHGPGQLWEEVRNVILEKKGHVIENSEIIKIKWINKEQVEATILNPLTKTTTVYTGDYLFSTMPIKDLINSMENEAPADIKRIANGLEYRDFITVGLLLKDLKIKNTTKEKTTNDLIPDNWIYIQEKDVVIGRLQIFNNWSPYLVADKNNVWIGLEYFCNEGDELWCMQDDEFIKFAIAELVKIDIIYSEDVIDSTIIRVQKAYPAYFGTYDELDKVIEFTNSFKNMFLVGRNGMHKYNNQDHSMLTAMVSVDNIIDNNPDKDNIWEINTEKEYHETSKKNSC